jgi:hypothetical protein
LETSTESEGAGGRQLFTEGGAESGALARQSGPIDPALASLIDSWHALPEPIKAGILAMIQVASG